MASKETNCQIESLRQIERLSLETGIPQADITLIALNTSGTRAKYKPATDRGRFHISLDNNHTHFLALSLTEKPLSDFEHNGEGVTLGGEVVAKATPIEPDTCTDSYWRKGNRHSTLNTNARSLCKGCAFCGTFSLEDDDRHGLTTEAGLQQKAKVLETETGCENLSGVESIALVTGCFPSEEQLVEHIMLTRKVFSSHGFRGEIQYIGSQLRKQENIEKILSEGPFALYLTVEAFQRRDKLMRLTKASLDLERGRKLLELAKRLGAATSFLYIVGLDDLKSIAEEFPKYSGLVTRLPQAQVLQIYTPKQIELRHPEASDFNYYLKARKIIESSLPDLRPDLGLNYRGLWFSTYNDKPL